MALAEIKHMIQQRHQDNRYVSVTQKWINNNKVYLKFIMEKLADPIMQKFQTTDAPHIGTVGYSTAGFMLLPEQTLFLIEGKLYLVTSVVTRFC